jgi:hypothetical protein
LLTALPGGSKAVGFVGFVYDGTLSIMVVADRSLTTVVDGVCIGMQEWFDDLGAAVAAQDSLPFGSLEMAASGQR